jgi:hypothetical protein
MFGLASIGKGEKLWSMSAVVCGWVLACGKVVCRKNAVRCGRVATCDKVVCLLEQDANVKNKT